jgi:hypothetical protein
MIDEIFKKKKIEDKMIKNKRKKKKKIYINMLKNIEERTT